MKHKTKIINIVAIMAIAAIGFIACDTGSGGGDKKKVDFDYELGDTGPGGGRIFYVADGKEGRSLGFTVEGYGNPGDPGYFATYTAHYLEAASSNSGTAQWGASTKSIPEIPTFTVRDVPEFSKIGNGRKYTMIIVDFLKSCNCSEHSPTPGETGRAAQIASTPQGGKADWFLPSAGELYLLNQNRDLAGINIISKLWSSSQSGNYMSPNHAAWFLNNTITGGRIDAGPTTEGSGKFQSNTVHAIRAF